MRGFFAFGVSVPLSEELWAVMNSFPHDPGLKPHLPGDYHVTIKFLSEFSSTKFVDCLESLLAVGKPPAQSLKAGKLALWPTAFVLECEASEDLRAWHSQINALLERKGFLRERHPRFSPHITLARKNGGRELPNIGFHLNKVENIFSGRWIPVERPALWQSQAEETGRRHRPLLSPYHPASRPAQTLRQIVVSDS